MTLSTTSWLYPSQDGDQMVQRLTVGYHYWYILRAGYGWRQIGPEMLCVMDDFGLLVPAEGARC